MEGGGKFFASPTPSPFMPVTQATLILESISQGLPSGTQSLHPISLRGQSPHCKDYLPTHSCLISEINYCQFQSSSSYSPVLHSSSPNPIHTISPRVQFLHPKECIPQYAFTSSQELFSSSQSLIPKSPRGQSLHPNDHLPLHSRPTPGIIPNFILKSSSKTLRSPAAYMKSLYPKGYPSGHSFTY